MASLLEKAVKYHSAGKVRDAVPLYRKFLKSNPDHVRALGNLAAAHIQMQRYELAIKVLERAVSVAPDDTECLSHLGLAHYYLGQLDDAQAALSRALTQAPAMPSANNNMALVLTAQDKAEAALAYFERSLAGDPGDVGVRLNYAVALAAAGRRRDAVHIFQDISKPLLAQGRFDAAADVFTYWTKAAPDDAAAQSGLGQALAGLGKYDAAMAAFEAGAACEPPHMEAIERYGQFLLDRGDYGAAKTIFLREHRAFPRRSSALGHLSIALRELDDPDLPAFVDYDRHLYSGQIGVPFGYADLQAFNDDLHRTVGALHIETPNGYQTMRGGTQNEGYLFDRKEPVILQLKAQLSSTIKAYVDRIGSDPDHPFERYKRHDFGFTDAWSTILTGGGYDGSHIHNEGWLSGVYYVKVPSLDTAQWTEGQACLQFGEPPKKYVTAKNTRARTVRPSAGTVVLFPSYYWHGVIPYVGSDERHAIAFDVR